MWLLTLLIGLLVVLAITAATGYFVAQEFSYMAVDRSRLKARAAGGDHAARRALAVTQRTSFMLSGAQLGITITALLVGYVAEPLIGASLGEALGGVGVPTGAGVAVGTVAALPVCSGGRASPNEVERPGRAVRRWRRVRGAVRPQDPEDQQRTGFSNRAHVYNTWCPACTRPCSEGLPHAGQRVV